MISHPSGMNEKRSLFHPRRHQGNAQSAQHHHVDHFLRSQTEKKKGPKNYTQTIHGTGIFTYLGVVETGQCMQNMPVTASLMDGVG